MRGYRMPLLSILLLFFIAVGAANAKTIYVSPEGNDERDGSAAQPLRTPGRALALAERGDTVYLHQGRYPIGRPLWLGKSDVTLASFPGEKALLIAGTDEKHSPPSVVIAAADNVTLLNLEIQGGAYYALKIDSEGAPAIRGVLVRGCRIHGSGRDCIKTYNADDLVILECQIGPSGLRDPSNAEGIDIIGSIGAIIRRCHIHDTATNGIYVKGGTRNALIEACRIENSGHGGILLGQDTDPDAMRNGVKFEAIDCRARNNIVVGAGTAGLGAYSASNVRFEDNTLVDVASKGQAAFWVVTNSRLVRSEGVSFRGNVVLLSSDRPFALLSDVGERFTCDSNIYYSTSGQYAFVRQTASPEKSESWSFEQWQKTLNVDQRSRVGQRPSLTGARVGQ